MTLQHDSMMEPRIEELLSKVDSKFTLVTLGAMRARQINAYYGQLGEGLGAMIPPQVTSVARKPLSMAFEEIAVDKIKVRRLTAEEIEAQTQATATGGLPAGERTPRVEVVPDTASTTDAAEPSEG